MKTICIVFLLTFCNLLVAQKINWKKHILPTSLSFTAGASDGLNQVLQYRYKSFEKAFPNANDQYWNPKYSWKNKYKEGTREPKHPGSCTWLVWTTDGYHATRFVSNLFNAGAVAFTVSSDKKKWYIYIIEICSYWLINRAGFAIVYNLF